MNISINWLRDYVEVGDIAELAVLLTDAGMEVEAQKSIGDGIEGVLVGEILSVEKHPQADNLKICTTHDGIAERIVVCGAPNVAAGQKVAFAVPGSQIAGHKISEKKLRGVDSYGMILSKMELGINDDHSGIWVLPSDMRLGQLLTEAAPIKDDVLEIDITANRPDLLSFFGVAREVAAATGAGFTKPDLSFEDIGGEIDGEMLVRIDDPDLCPRYSGIIVADLKILPSPIWMELRLNAIGQRNINNIVDISNYVLHECGQPLHAFDLEFLEKSSIIVRRSKPGESIITLDEQERKLSGEELLICDGEKPVALAGVMGGLNSLVSDNTQSVFIESACFNPVNIRRTSKRIGLNSDSSYRFERGIDIEGVLYGLHRSARLMAELGQGSVLPGFIDNYPKKREPQKVSVRTSRVNWILGTTLDTGRISKLLDSIELSNVETQNDILQVKIPAFRVDIEREIDLIEEVSRLYGLKNIKETLPATMTTTFTRDPLAALIEQTKDIMIGQGFSEMISIGMTSPENLDLFRKQPGHYVTLCNPLTVEMSALKDMLMPGLCRALSLNLAHQTEDIALFEMRRVYIHKDADSQPDEPTHLAAILSGRRETANWSHSNELVDFWDIKGAMEEVFEGLRIAHRIAFQADESNPAYLPGSAALISLDEQRIGHIGRLSPKLLQNFEIEKEAYAFEIDISALSDKALADPEFSPWPKFPAVFRDLAVVINETQSVQPMIDAIYAADQALIKAVSVFDVYRGKGIDPGKKSIAFSIRIQSSEGTMKFEQINSLIDSIVSLLGASFGADLRI
jgi:phenylalanyl-tRNA synthetase beta chain